MNRQNVTDIQLAILELDGCVFNLNHYRYNFYKNLASQRDLTVTPEEFHEHLGNMYTMYDELPLAKAVGPQLLNKRVEKDLLNYMRLKKATAQEGINELIEYFRQKHIKIAVFSTHKTSTAMDYLELAGLSKKVDYVIGSDTKLAPLPSTEMLSFLAGRYKVKADQILVITSIFALEKAASSLGMNVIFKEDLIPATTEEKRIAFTCVKNMYDVLNTVMFDHLENYKIFEPALGMTPDLDRKQLKEVYERLKENYKDDPELLKVVEDTYRNRLADLEREHPRFIFSDEEDPITLPVELRDSEFVHRIKYTTDDTPESPSFVEQTEVKDEDMDEVGQSSFEDEYPAKEQEEKQEPETIKVAVDNSGALSLDDEEAQDLSEVLSKVLNEEPEPIHYQAGEVSEDVIKKRPHPILNGLLNVVFTLMFSLLIMVVGLFVYVIFINNFERGNLQGVAAVYQQYSDFSNMYFKALLDGLHSVINFIPSYASFTSGKYLSYSASQLVAVYVTNTLIIIVVEIIIALIKRLRTHKQEEEEE